MFQTLSLSRRTIVGRAVIKAMPSDTEYQIKLKRTTLNAIHWHWTRAQTLDTAQLDVAIRTLARISTYLKNWLTKTRCNAKLELMYLKACKHHYKILGIRTSVKISQLPQMVHHHTGLISKNQELKVLMQCIALCTRKLKCLSNGYGTCYCSNSSTKTVTNSLSQGLHRRESKEFLRHLEGQ